VGALGRKFWRHSGQGRDLQDGTYTFFGAAGATPCSRDGACEGAFTFSSTLDHVTGGKAGKPVFGRGAGPAGWTDIDRIGA
jgi:hypothetical protein